MEFETDRAKQNDSIVDAGSRQQRPRLMPRIAGTALNLLSLEQAGLAFARMRPLDVAPGEVVISQGERGEQYFLLETGLAEVWRTDPISEQTAMVALLGPGSVFGEEALLIDGFRNATVRMHSAGCLWALDKADFNALVRPGLVETIDAAEAFALVASGAARWLDCRYEMEFAECHIPGAWHVPLDRLRERAGELDSARTYIVYCRSGQRSACAAYLLRERGIPALSLLGGIRDWPYETRAT
jgi:rhodanese-related sulfurtransferase